MARPRSEDPRTVTIAVRVTPTEKAKIGERAIEAGMKPGEFVRARALGLKPRGLTPEPAVSRAPVRTVNPNVTATAIEKEEVAAEVAEARLGGPEAHDAFVDRRTLQLMGQGSTRLVARRRAQDEWASRGTNTA